MSMSVPKPNYRTKTLVIPTTCFLHLQVLCLLISNTVGSSSERQQFFTIHQSKSMPTTRSNIIDAQIVPSRMACARECTGNKLCLSFYAERQQTSGEEESSWDCKLISERIKGDQLASGPGDLGIVLGYYDDNNAPPYVLAAGEFLFLTKSKHGTAAIYDCSSVSPNNMSTVGLMYNDDQLQWPPFEHACQASLCQQLGLSATFLKINSASGTHQVQTLCRDDAVHSGDATCDVHGNWVFDSPLGVGCVPSTCYRHNIDGAAIYTGNTNASREGIACQRWDLQTPVEHEFDDSDFQVDGYNISKSSNFCRDPIDEGKLWCHVMDVYRWDYCEVPLCQWPF